MNILAAIFEPDLALVAFLAAVIVAVVAAILLRPGLGHVMLAVAVALIALGLLLLTPDDPDDGAQGARAATSLVS